MSASTPASMTAPEQAELLLSNFKRGQQVLPRRSIRTQGLFDITKIGEVLAKGGIATDPVPYVAMEEVLSEQVEIYPALPNRIFPQPDDARHYIFRIAQQGKAPPLHAVRLKNVYLSWDASGALKRAYYLFDQDKRLINGLFFGAAPFLEPVRAEFEAPVAFAEDVFMRFNIAHLLYDKIPRAHIARDRMGVEDSLLFFTNGYTDTIADLSGLRLHGLANDTPRGTVFFKELVCFTNSFMPTRHPMYNGASAHIAALQDLRARAEARLGITGEPVKYFLTRAPHLPRGITNMEEITPLLIEHGFEIGDAATLSPVEQIKLFLRCSHLGGAHGAGLTNLVFQPDGAQVVELMPPFAASMSYWKSADALGRAYRPVTCHDPELGDIAAERGAYHVGNDNRRQLYVPLDRLAASLTG